MAEFLNSLEKQKILQEILSKFSIIPAYPFCIKCTKETVNESSGNTFTLNGIGTKLYGCSSKCVTCGSVIKTLFFCLFFIPIIPLGKYRVISYGSTFRSRRIQSELENRIQSELEKLENMSELYKNLNQLEFELNNIVNDAVQCSKRAQKIKSKQKK